MTITALVGADLILPDQILSNTALLLRGERIIGWTSMDALPADTDKVELEGGWLLPGFIDTQCNGGGDVLLNDDPTASAMEAIADAHRRFGTTGLLPTLISDHADVVEAALSAAEEALSRGAGAILGVHIEGPHLNAVKKGIHDQDRFAPLDDDALARFCRPFSGRRIITIAPELAPPGSIRSLAAAGNIVAAGHSMADYDQTLAALEEGLSGFTHLFNAMTPMGSREPGMVGAALQHKASHFGIIVDGLHVHPASLRVALRARGIEGAMLVTDAMPPVGGAQNHFTLMGQHIHVVDGTCRGPDGTLAGSALSMVQALRNAMDMMGLSIVEASRLASGNPAAFLRLETETGSIAPGLRADLVHLNGQRRVTRTWIGGAMSEDGECR